MRSALGFALLLCACTEAGTDARGGEDQCNLSEGRTLAELPAGSFDALASLQTPTGALVAWSSAEGSFVRPLGRVGAPAGDAVRVGERCSGGLALADAHPRGFWVACLHPERGATLTRLSAELDVGEAKALGPAGRDSEGITVVTAGKAVSVAYHDGTEGAYAVYLVTGDGQRFAERRRLSDPAYAATAPHLVAAEGHWIASWAETRLSIGDGAATRIALQREGGPVRTLGETPLDRPDARIVWGENGPWLGFRSRRKRDRHPQLYVMRLERDLDPHDGEPVRVGRANTLAPPVVHECGGQRFAHMSRLYGGERYVALYPLDDRLHSLGGGYQYYENGHDYEQIAVTCSAEGPLLVTAERPKDPEGSARLTSAVLDCPAVVEPHGCSFPCTSR